MRSHCLRCCSDFKAECTSNSYGTGDIGPFRLSICSGFVSTRPDRNDVEGSFRIGTQSRYRLHALAEWSWLTAHISAKADIRQRRILVFPLEGSNILGYDSIDYGPDPEIEGTSKPIRRRILAARRLHGDIDPS